MNVLCLTQARSLDLFSGLVDELRGRHGGGQAGFWVADRDNYERFLRVRPDFEREAIIGKEWQALAASAHGMPDFARLRELERRLGDPTLWGALIADRRVSQGPRAALRQDYRPRYPHPRMLRILEETDAALERLFDTVRPDVVLSFICVTVGDYLGYRIARARGIPFFNLRPTRVRNFVHLAQDVFEPSARVQEAYERRRSEGTADAADAEAAHYMERLRTGDARYEGVLTSGPAAPRRPVLRRAVALLARLASTPRDPHAAGHFDTLWTTRVVRPARRRALARLIAEQGRVAGPLPASGYALFPLHTEPEVTLLVYSRQWLNQIEVVRLLAQSLPLGMPLLVKEHPASAGKRPRSYYEKLTAIPGVRLVAPELPSRPLVENAALVATIAGSIGLEAVLRGRPVLLFGHAPYEILPPSMVRRVGDPGRTADDVAALLASARFDPDAARHYLAAVIAESVPIDLYSRLLRRTEAFSERPAGSDFERERRQDLAALAAEVERSRAWWMARSAGPAS